MEVRQLSDNQRRTICRISFLFGCVLPLSLVMYMIIHPQTPADWQQAVQARLGIATSIESVETPGPFETRLRNLELSDPELGSLLTADEIRILRGRVNHVIIDSPVSISASKLLALVSAINDHVIRSQQVDRTWRLEFKKARIDANDSPGNLTRSMVLSPVQIEILPRDNGTLAKVQFRNILEPENWVRLFVERSQQEGQLQQKLILDTNTGYLPCWLVAEIVPELKRLGSDCQFNGYMEMVQRGGPGSAVDASLDARLFGFMQNINLQELVRPFRQTLTGRCNANISNCVIRNGKFQQLNFEASCDHGVIGKTLMASAVEHLNVAVNPELDASQDVYGYQDLQLSCHIEGDQFTISNPVQGRANLIAFDSNRQPLIGFYGEASSDQFRVRNPIDRLGPFLVQPTTDRKRYNEETIRLLSRFQLSPAWRTAATSETDTAPLQR